ncbi:MAG: Rieske (2Fe-2S) protein [Candidatus Acidiferrum sp.]
MKFSEHLSRRAMLAKLGIFFNSIVALLLAVPIFRYLLSPVFSSHSYESWLMLGSIDQYPIGQTRLTTFRNPDVQPWDGKTADSACWVRRMDAQAFQVFAINCAHLNCPVRWFPQSGLFMCPCHGGVYYEDGSRASGPPERGLFEYPYKIQGGKLFIKAGEMPTYGSPSALVKLNGKSRCS